MKQNNCKYCTPIEFPTLVLYKAHFSSQKCWPKIFEWLARCNTKSEYYAFKLQFW